MVSLKKLEHLKRIGFKKGHHIGLGIKHSYEHIRKKVQSKKDNLAWRRIIRKYTKIRQTAYLTKREEVLDIIQKHRLGGETMGEWCGCDASEIRRYIAYNTVSPELQDKIETTIINWRNEMHAKRRKLLQHTPYAHLYK